MKNSSLKLPLPTMSQAAVKLEAKEGSNENNIMEGGSFIYYKFHELKQVSEKLASLAEIVLPIMFTGLLTYSRSFISMLFLGHLGDAALSGGSLSISFANITGYSVLKGLAMGMQPISHQAYGAKRWGTMISVYRKTLFLLLAMTLIISLLWLNIEPILLWMGQDQDIVEVAKTYLWYSIPDLIAQAHFHPLKTFLRTQNINQPITLSILAAMVLHFPINYFLVVYLNLGVMGVALAAVWNTINVNLGLLIYLYFSKYSLNPWDWGIKSIFTEGWEGWKSLLRFALSSVLSVCLEWWYYEILMLLCSILSNPQATAAAMGILIQLTSLLYVFPFSLNSGLAMQVGRELGAGRNDKAKQSAVAGTIVAVLWGIVAFLLTTAIKDVWGKLFTSDTDILALTSAALPILGFCELGNSPQTAAGGILVGSARPNIGFRINFVAFYLIGLPVTALLTFQFKMGFVGLWYGLAAAEISCICIMACTLIRTDWLKEASRARELTQGREGSTTDLEEPLLQ